MDKHKLDIKQNVNLAAYTTMQVGGQAQYFVEAKTVVDVVKAVGFALKKSMPYFVLGSGSNIIISDKGYNGLVIYNHTKDLLVDEGHSILQVDSGVKSGRAASVSASAGLSGLEFYFGIPGTVGGAVYGNAGIRGFETKDVLKDVVCLIVKDEDPKKPVIVRKKREWMQYDYRSSILKKEHFCSKYPPVILTARFQLYPARKEVIMERTKEFNQKRSNQPYGLKTAGCIFRNPGSEPEQAAGKLLDDAGAKRITAGGAAVAKKHANFLYNRKEATAGDILELIDKCQLLVKNKYNIDLQREVELIGDF